MAAVRVHFYNGQTVFVTETSVTHPLIKHGRSVGHPAGDAGGPGSMNKVGTKVNGR